MSDNNITDINKMSEDFKDLKDYSDAQYTVISDLHKKIKKLEEENKHLQSILNTTVPNLSIATTDLTVGISNEQLICETQILILKEAAITRSLTMEEARKLQIFVDVLEKIKKDNKNTDMGLEALSVDDLLKLANEPGEKTN